MKINNLAFGHGVIYYEVTYDKLSRKDIIVQYVSLYICHGDIEIQRWEGEFTKHKRSSSIRKLEVEKDGS